MSTNHSDSRSTTTSAHRLPTQSAVGVLRAAKEESARNRPISTGLANLDAILRPRYAHSKTNSQGGLAVGQITEVIGPPGIGRTALCLQFSSTVLTRDVDDYVMWVDAHSILPRLRLQNVHSNHAPSIVGAGSKSPVDNDLTASRFRHIYIPSLAHLFALLIRPPVGFWSAKTRLVVIDGLSTLFDQAYPRHGRTVAVGTDTDPKHIDSSATLRRRYKAAEDRRRRDVDAAAATLTCHLLRLASLHTSAVILTGDLVTKVRQWTGFGPTSSTQTALQATLRPASYGFDWDTAIATRLVLYHGDLFSRQASVSTIWREITHPKPSEDTTCRFLCVTKIRGIVLSEQAAFGQAVSFIVNETGIIKATADDSIGLLSTPMPQDINTELAVSGAIKDSTNTKVRHDIKTMETVEKERPMQDIGRSNKRSLSEIVADSDESDFGSDQA